MIELVSFNTADGHRLDGLLFDAGGKVAVVHVHGKCGNFYQNDFIRTMLSLYPANGVSFLTFNNRGHDCVAETYRPTGVEYLGGSLEDFADCTLDIDAALAFVQKRLKVSSIFLQGHSNGAEKSLYYAVATGKDAGVEGLILLGLSDSFEMQRRWVNRSGTPVPRRSGTSPDGTLSLSLTEYGISTGDKHYPIPIELSTLARLKQGPGFAVSRIDDPQVLGRLLGTATQGLFGSPALLVYGARDPYLSVGHSEMCGLVSIRTGGSVDVSVVQDVDHHFHGRENALVEVVLDWMRK